MKAESGTDTESFKIDIGVARTDQRRPRSEPNKASEKILTPRASSQVGSSLSWLICGGRWWVAGWVAVAGKGGFGWLAVVVPIFGGFQ